LRQAKENAVDALQECSVMLGLNIQKLQSQMDKNGTLQKVDELVDLHQEANSDVLHLRKSFDKSKRQIIRLRQQAERKSGHRIVTPAPK
jgi:hypothetical protein